MAIIVTENGKNAQILEKNDFSSEGELQEYIYENPETIPMYEIDEDIRVLILMREFPTNSGPIDAIGLDANGNIYIIETKLYKNPDKRLVVSQVLDYGAAIWSYYSDFSDFITRLDTGSNERFGVGMNQKIIDFFDLGEDYEIEDLLDKVKNNLNKGIFKFVVLMDKLEDRLKDLILFINKNSQFDIYAVEVEYYRFKDHELMIPKIFGNEIKKDIDVTSKSGTSTRRQWSESSFFDDLSLNIKTEYVDRVKDVYDYFVKDSDKIKWGTGSYRGSFNVIYEDICQRSVLTIWSDGQLTVNYGWLNSTNYSTEFRDSLKEKFADKLNGDTGNQWHNYTIEDWISSSEWICSVVTETVKETLKK